MKKVINCYKEHNPIIQKKLKEVSVEEGLTIAAELFEILNKRKDGIGLAANQVGIDAAVAVVNVREPLILINPKIEEQWDEIDYYEGCLSYPDKGVRTKRYKNIIINTDQSESGWYFSGEGASGDHKGTWEKDSEDDANLRLLEAVCVQHEIDHLNGVRCLDREVNMTVKRTEQKVGRNEKCPCGSGKKYKKCCINKN